MMTIEEALTQMRLYAEDDHYDPDVGGWIMAIEAAIPPHAAMEIQRLEERVASAGDGLREKDAEIERLREAMTGWSNYGWKNGVFVDDLAEFFDAALNTEAKTNGR